MFIYKHIYVCTHVYIYIYTHTSDVYIYIYMYRLEVRPFKVSGGSPVHLRSKHQELVGKTLWV